MIQFNLLPDIKLQYIKAKRAKRTVIVVSLLVGASSLAVFVFLFITVHGFQKQHMNKITEDIAIAQKTLDETPDLNKVLTIQNQLNSLPNLHNQKPVTGRIYDYIYKITPSNVNIGKTELNFADNTVNFYGTASSLSHVNKFVDTMKFTKYTIVTDNQIEGQPQNSDNQKPFSDVVLTSFEVDEETGEITYNITAKFDLLIFDNNKTIKLDVPNITSTRSETEKPDELFKALPAPEIKTEQ